MDRIASMIRLRGVGKTYDDGTVAVHELDLDVGTGELVCPVVEAWRSRHPPLVLGPVKLPMGVST